MEQELRELVEKWKNENINLHKLKLEETDVIVRSSYTSIVIFAEIRTGELQQILDKYEYKSHVKAVEK